jgi:hypothetical protein
LERAGDPQAAFAHLERAHVLGQASTLHHVRVHLRMLAWGWRRRSPREVLGQITRVIGAATKTALGWVPTGNTGGANVSPFRSMPVPPDLAQHIHRARHATP